MLSLEEIEKLKEQESDFREEPRHELVLKAREELEKLGNNNNK